MLSTEKISPEAFANAYRKMQENEDRTFFLYLAAEDVWNESARSGSPSRGSFHGPAKANANLCRKFLKGVRLTIPYPWIRLRTAMEWGRRKSIYAAWETASAWDPYSYPGKWLWLLGKFFLSSEDEDVRKPIKSKNIQLKERKGKDKGNILMALLRYEQLICSKWGSFGHIAKECPTKLAGLR